MIPDSRALLEGYQRCVDAKYEHSEGSPEWIRLDKICDRLCWLYVSASHAEKGESAHYPLGSAVG